jgi:hypothetical protein
MPSSQRPAYNWPIRLSFTVEGKKPCKADIPGLDIVECGRFPNGRRRWVCCLDGLYAN